MPREDSSTSSQKQRKIAGTALRDEEVWLRAAVESLAEGLMLTDLEGHVRYVNPRLVEMTGYPADELTAVQIFELAGSAAAEKREQQRSERRARGLPDTYETRIRRRDGGYLWVRVSTSPLRDAAGEEVGALVTYTDIDEQKQAEEKLRLLQSAVEEAEESIVITLPEPDPAMTETVYVNPAFERLTGYSAEEVIGVRGFNLLGPKSSWNEHGEEEHLSRGEPSAGETTLYHKDGSELLLDWRVAPIRSADGEVTHFAAICRDVSEQRRLAEQLRQSQKMEAVGQLAGGVAHDFNNLLTAILGYGHMLLGKLAPGDSRRRAVEQINAAADKAQALTGQLLAFSRKQHLELKTVDLNGVVAGLEEMLRRLLGEDIDLTTRLETQLGTIRADPSQLEQVILNLAINARDAMPTGGTLALETTNAEVGPAQAEKLDVEPGAYVQLAVSDSGQGMDAETKERIFEPFFTTKEIGEGTGLGLATVYGIVKQSDGFLSVQSEPGEGTTFIVHLPRTASAAEPAPKAAVPSYRTIPGEETVLLAEDDEVVRTLVQEVLADSGYRVLVAANGEEALAIATDLTTPIDLLISDVVMPDIRGPDLSRRILEHRPDLHILFISGYAGGTMIRRGELGRGAHFLQKPFSPEALMRKVRDVLTS